MPMSGFSAWRVTSSGRLVGLCLLVALQGCAVVQQAPPDEVRVVGSDTMLVLNRRLAEEYMRAHPGAMVLVAGGGTGRGVEVLLTDRAVVCAASRPLRATEVRQLHERFETLGVRYLVARDALSVYLNPANPVRDLSMQQLRGLFTGDVRSWQQVGGPELEVLPVIRPPTSGTHHFFRQHVLRGESYAPGALTAPRTADVVAAVLAHRGAVGFGGVAYGGEGVHARVEGAPPSARAVRNGTYPLARYLYFYTVAPPRGEVRRFVDWCLAEPGQRVVQQVGYVPLWLP